MVLDEKNNLICEEKPELSLNVITIMKNNITHTYTHTNEEK